MKLIKFITSQGEFFFGKDKIEFKNNLKVKTRKNISSYLINDFYIIISSDKIVFECSCGNLETAIWSNFKNRKYDLCTSCIRKKTVQEVHNKMSKEKRQELNKKISETTKQAMNSLSPEKRQEMTKKMIKSLDWEKRNKKWYETMKNKSALEKQEIRNKISRTQQNKTEEEKNIIKNKIKYTFLKKYGVYYLSQNTEILKRQIEARNDSWKLKHYKSKFGPLIYQTKPELNFIKFCEHNNIFIKNGPSIDYMLNNQNLKYTIDFETEKYLIEIKQSHIWYYKDLKSGKIDAKNKAAQKYAALLNKQFLFLLDEKDYTCIILQR